MAAANNALDRAKERLEIRGDTFLDSAGEKLFTDLKTLATDEDEAAKAVKEIEHRRSQKIE